MVAKPKSTDSNRDTRTEFQTPPDAGLTRVVNVDIIGITQFCGSEVTSKWKNPMLLVETSHGTFMSHYGEARRPQELKASVVPVTLYLSRCQYDDEVPIASTRGLGSSVPNAPRGSLLSRLKG